MGSETQQVDINGNLHNNSSNTTDLIGEHSEQIMSIGDARIAVTIGKDEDTIELCRGLRFLIDDTDSEAVLAYEITKPNKLFNVFNGEGVFRFILHEVNLESGDNKELRIANYADWHPPIHSDSNHVDCDIELAEIVQAAIEESEIPPDDDKEVWL